MMTILAGILTAIGGVVVVLVVYIFLFKKVTVRQIPEEEGDFIDLELAHLELGRALIQLNNLKMGLKQAGAPPEVTADIEHIFKIVHGVQVYFDVDEPEQTV